jgi:hypothetical protein
VKVITAIVLVLALVGAAFAQDAQAPQLTDVQKLQLQNAAQRVEIAQLRAQQAMGEFERLVQSLQVQGYELDLQKLTYVKKDEPKK